MLERAMSSIKKLACRHEWVKTGVFQDVDPEANIRYAIRRYQCAKCGKVSCQDSRFDRIEARAAGKDVKA